jgi:hypothetical protein
MRRSSVAFILMAALSLAACNEEVKEEGTTTEVAVPTEKPTSEEKQSNISKLQNGETEKAEENSVETVGSLDSFTDEQIEALHIWAQFGANQEITELNYRLIEAGTALNEDDETSSVYPVNVVQLSGSRLVDGVVTYAKNTDGSITLYNIPLRWDGENPAGEAFYKDLLANTSIATIQKASEKQLNALADVLAIQ